MKHILSFSSVLVVPAVLAVLSTGCREARSATATYKIDGMTCDACASNIETSVGKIEGVVAVEASYKEGQAVVTYDADKVAPGAIEAVVDGLGYPADLADAPASDPAEPQKR
ncbi:MAG TPA: heavy-metal-associated domain-containing protein [Thermoanaerobaculia bacterium]|nr:heavy-metal-associated domain-containing protein [Thermoanaerobaculia bacterium]